MGIRASAAFILTILLALGGPAFALETDQFTVPDGPLADIGPELEVYVLARVWDVVQESNRRAVEHEREAKLGWSIWTGYHRSEAARYRSEDYLAKRVYEALAGGGLPECRIEQWAERHRFRAARPDSPALFWVSSDRSVYGEPLFGKPLLLVELSPTINVHGCYIGLDKLGHVFQQGYEYFQEYRQEEQDGGDAGSAEARAVRLGVGQEEGLFGELLVGVYSNADLAANYAGLKFYLNLTRPVRVGQVILPPLLVRDRDGNWGLNPRRHGADPIRLLVSDHFNEALNPCRYAPGLRTVVRENLQPRMPRLLAFYTTDAGHQRALLDELSTWHGEDYGHRGLSRLVTIADNCPREVAPPAGERSPPRVAAARLSTR